MNKVCWIGFLVGALFGFILGIGALLGRIALVTQRLEKQIRSARPAAPPLE